MRILLTAAEFPPGPGGIAAQALELAAGLARRSFEVTVVALQDYAGENQVRDFNSKQPFKVVRLRHMDPSILEGVYRWAVLRRELARSRADVLITSADRPTWLAPLLRVWTHRPHLAIGHGTEFGRRPDWELRLTRWSFQRASAVVCVSDYTRSRMHALGICPACDRVIPNGADERRFYPMDTDAVRQLRVRTGDLEAEILLTVGRLCDRKGQDVVIRALPAVLKQRPRVHYMMAGLPEKEAELRKIADDTGVSAHIHFLGPVVADVLPAVYNACDVFVLTSRHAPDGSIEGYGIAAVEAALCGKPSVVTRGSGLQEAIEPGRTGLLVAEDSPEETGAALLELLGDREKRLRMGSAARARALSEQTWDARLEAYAQLLRDLVRPGAA